MQELITFQDVLIKPKFSMIESRKDVDLSYNGRNFPYMDLSVVSANMDSITTDTLARAMLTGGAQACLHRFQSISDNVKMFTDSVVGGTGGSRAPFASIGLGKSELERAEALVNAGCYTLVLDLAHGAQMSVVRQVQELRQLLGSKFSLVVGNFATGQSVRDFLGYLKPDSIQGVKAGIGPGAICKTRVVTGCGYPQLSAIMEIANELKYESLAIIADGGISNSGDAAKAFAAGASMIMSGSLFSGTDETPGETVWKYAGQYRTNEEYQVGFENGHLQEHRPYKKYRGSASKESYEIQGKTAQHRAEEGETILVPCKGPVANVLQQLEGGLRSAFTYVGAKTLAEFQERAEFVRVSNSTVIENGIRGGNK